ncbi:MAG: AraC family transcriptional regulator [Clostridiales bacterium]|nr:AraC family transcriptional regulator [Clostridiales bacterium]
MDIYENKGYLNSEFKLFHLCDTNLTSFNFHYHEFDKIIIFLKGDVTYMIEGKNYKLKPYDIVIVNHNHIHKPNINFNIPYERIIIYVSPNFIKAYKTDNYDLSLCFQKAKAEHSNVLRINSLATSKLFEITNKLEDSLIKKSYAYELYNKILFLEFMINLNKAAINNELEYIKTKYNKKVNTIIEYINSNLDNDLSLDSLSKKFFISKYHMIRQFKAETGVTLGKFINNKRLLLARDLILEDLPLTEVCYKCGFKDYSTFSRRFKEMFHVSPSKFKFD